MNIRSSLEQLITEQKPGALPGLALLPLAGASYIFQGIVRLRRVLYEKGVFRSFRLPKKRKMDQMDSAVRNVKRTTCHGCTRRCGLLVTVGGLASRLLPRDISLE